MNWSFRQPLLGDLTSATSRSMLQTPPHPHRAAHRWAGAHPPARWCSGLHARGVV